ncbi:FAD-dependent oxidoreductase [Ruficoccus amylovorans]|uniref:FAD-dependent oxidoreductase n=1 Tax=Ruficoccus amylovorans TaxID=1804625 RepID=A0A842HI85_9BACT|nr:FAD-dependent oxidoreductase [Ruficoccus amylovorans]MBC2595274.1 FAD-dependent oxidoreductase [Ruficoccus amylovorans]
MKTDNRLPQETLHADICVVGGGMTGLIAAVAAARRGCSVVLVHDRPVLGGNASSEIRMWICGAHGQNNKETGLLEEIQLCNQLRNPQGTYSVWDSVLFEYGRMTPGLNTLLNCSCLDAQTEDGRLVSIDAWQLTTQTRYRIHADIFIDSSGDSILAPLSGAETRSGRESREEFDESLAPLKSDLKTMGNTLLLQLEETPFPQSFTPPRWAYHFDENSNLPSRVGTGFGHNFWWLELGGLGNTITDTETYRDELYKAAWGVWDYMKNRGPQAEKLANWRLGWLGALPGKRENRRYLGDHVLTQNDIDAGGLFEDIVAYGGWSMDDHHPAGLYYPGKATIFHPAPSPYGIPLRSLYSRNIQNLFCAGRNISATHCALSSSRVMGTCSIIGQAVGTAAVLCHRRSIRPGQITGPVLKELQQMLMEDDCWLPGLVRPAPAPMADASLNAESGEVRRLLDGHERIMGKEDHAWEAPAGTPLTVSWDSPRKLECLRLVFDSDLNDSKRLPERYRLQERHCSMPKQLVRDYRIEVQTPSGQWETVHHETENRRRLAVLPLQREIRGLRFTGEAAWGDSPIRVFSLEAHDTPLPLSREPAPGASWVEVIAGIDPEDLKEPDHGLEKDHPHPSRVGA